MIALRRWMLETALPPLAFFALFVTLWQAVTVLWNIPLYLVPPPARVLAVARENAGPLMAATRLTAAGALCGFALSIVAGTVLGLLFSQSRIIERGIYPYAIFLQTVPIVAIAPLVVTWFGNGFTSVVVVSFALQPVSDHYERHGRTDHGGCQLARIIRSAQRLATPGAI